MKRSIAAGLTPVIQLRAVAIALVLLAGAAAPLSAQLQGPPRADLTPVLAADGVHPGTTIRAAIQVELPEGLHVNANQPRDPSLIPIVLTVEPPAGVSVDEIAYPEATDLEQKGAAELLAVYEREFAIRVLFTVAGDVPPGELAVPARLRYQACDDEICYFPATASTGWTLNVVAPGTPVRHGEVVSPIRSGPGDAAESSSAAGELRLGGGDPLSQLEHFTIRGTTAGQIGTRDFIGFIRNAEAGIQETGWFEGRGLAAILLIVLVGGLALNLTPCVLPMIPINLAIIGAGVQAGSRRRGFLLGAAYGGAMAMVYGALGLIVILTAGTFGAINASPWFNLAIAAIFVVLALAMFDVITIDFSRFSNRLQIGAAGRGTFLVAFGMGAVAALLAGACVAPVVIQVVLFSSNLYASGTTAALALPFLLGIGMAIPWPLAGAGISAIPKPGAWMVRVKQAFGVFILATAVYYGYLGYTLLADRWVDPAAVAASVEEKLQAGWHASLGEGLAAAQREQKPVLVDLWATWCKACLTMDRTTLADPAVTEALTDYVKIKFQAEDPDDPTVRAVMQRFGAIGLPTYVILEPGT